MVKDESSMWVRQTARRGPMVGRNSTAGGSAAEGAGGGARGGRGSQRRDSAAHTQRGFAFFLKGWKAAEEFSAEK